MSGLKAYLASKYGESGAADADTKKKKKKKKKKNQVGTSRMQRISLSLPSLLPLLCFQRLYTTQFVVERTSLVT